MRFATLLVIVMALSMAIPASAGSVPEEDPLPRSAPYVEIVLNEGTRRVEVDKGDTGTVDLSGTVNIDDTRPANAQTILVTLKYDAGAFVATGTSTVTIEGTHTSAPFNCRVKAPPGTLAGEYAFTVTGTWRYIPGTMGGECTPDSAVIVVEPFSRPVLFIPNADLDIQVGEDRTVDIFIRNDGNCFDGYLMIYDHPEDMRVSGPRRIEVVPGHNASVQLTVEMDGVKPSVGTIGIYVNGSYRGIERSCSRDVRIQTHLGPGSFMSYWYYILVAIVVIVAVGIAITLLVRMRRDKAKDR